MSTPRKLRRMSQIRNVKEKKRLLEKVEHISFNEARRLKEPIYRVLIKELYEEGCNMAGDYFTCLVLKERRLFAQLITRNWVKDEEELLLKLHENVKTAEKAAKLAKCGGMVACLKILHQSIMLLNSYADTYGWLLNDLWDLFVDIAEKADRGTAEDLKCDEIRAHLFVDYGTHLSRNAENLDKSVRYFLKSLELCRSQLWPARISSDPQEVGITLHDHVAIQFSKALIRYGKIYLSTDPALGIDLVHKAIVELFEVSHADTKILIGEAFVMKVNLLIEQKNFKKALANIALVHRRMPCEISDAECAHINCEIFQQQGICLQQLEDYPSALVKFKQSLLISRKFDLRRMEALALLHIGKLYSMYPDGNGKAMEALARAKVIFGKLADVWNLKRCDYALAQIHLILISPELLKLIKSSSTFCGLYQMRQWKYMKKPSWQSVVPPTAAEVNASISTLQEELNMEEGEPETEAETEEKKDEPETEEGEPETEEGEPETEAATEEEVKRKIPDPSLNMSRSFNVLRRTLDRTLALDEVDVSEEDMFRIEDNWTKIESHLRDNEKPEDCMWN